MSADTKEKDMAVLGCLGLLMLVPVTVAYSTLVSGFALWCVWGWFAVPIFHAPALTLAAACAVQIVVAILRGPAAEQEKTEAEKERGPMLHLLYRLYVVTMVYAFMLGAGYVIKAVWL